MHASQFYERSTVNLKHAGVKTGVAGESLLRMFRNADYRSRPLPAVSVVIPFKNAASTLPECLDSIQRQTLRDFEALFLDDGSVDASARIIWERSRRDGRIRLLEPGRVGLVKALNIGISQSRAPLIARMDADDLMHSDRLLQQHQFLHCHPDIALVGCRVKFFSRDAVRAGYREYVRWQNRCVDPGEIAANLYVESPLAHPSVMVRSSVLVEAGGYAEGPFPEDYDLWLRLHQAGHRMAKLPEVLLSWRDLPSRTSRVDPRYSKEAFDRLRARYLARDARLLTARKIVVWGGGRPTRSRVRLLLQQGVRANAWVDVNPRRIGKTIWGLPVHGPEWLDRTERPFVLVYVTNHGARDEISRALDGWGYRCGADYLAVG